MLSNLSPRERILAIVAGSLVPMMIVLFGISWFASMLQSSDGEIASLRSSINRAETLAIRQAQSARRLVQYKALSLSSESQTARAGYREWLGQLSDNVFGENRFTIESFTQSTVQSKIRNPSRPTEPPRTIYRELTVKLNAPAVSLDQINQFLHDFYQAPILHRISAISAAPLYGRAGTAGANLPTGKIGLLVTISVLSLSDAPEEKVIGTEPSETLDRSLALYREKIENRNIFGLPNNAPEITTGNQTEYAGREFAFNITGRDPDANDLLKFELVSSDLPAAALEQRDPQSKSAQLTADAPQPGNYSVVVRVTDDGFPPKSLEKVIGVEIKQRVETQPVVERKPDFKHAREAVITAIVRDKAGNQIAWIHVRTLGETHQVAVGESFQLDEQEWKLASITNDVVSLEVAGNVRTYELGDRLSEPKTESTTTTTVGPPEGDNQDHSG